MDPSSYTNVHWAVVNQLEGRERLIERERLIGLALQSNKRNGENWTRKTVSDTIHQLHQNFQL